MPVFFAFLSFVVPYYCRKARKERCVLLALTPAPLPQKCRLLLQYNFLGPFKGSSKLALLRVERDSKTKYRAKKRAWWMELNNKICLLVFVRIERVTGSTSCEAGGGFLKVSYGSCFWPFIRQCLFRFRWSLLNSRVHFFTQSVCAVCIYSIIEGSGPRGGSSCTLSEVTVMAAHCLAFGLLVISKLMRSHLLGSQSSSSWPQNWSKSAILNDLEEWRRKEPKQR